MNVDKMRHQLRRGAGEALVINGLSYGRTSADVMRDRDRPFESRFASRADALAKAWANVFSAVPVWRDPSVPAVDAIEQLRVRMAEEQVVGPAAEQPEDEDQRQ